MKTNELKQIISDCCNDVLFTYNGLKSGVTSEVYASIPFFQVWHGDTTKNYYNIDDLMNDKFFSGKSIIELSKEIQFEFA